ncbi:hypothetical protein SDRG_03899 [Saprolegnia diclina VS20]|uniref:Uncharacterized protein n=1 Tax=Saprolegnia diclina (strain VS20) TaxID=1156394 RepID=T0QLK5_SAPDV|nr:hypothetical protein SDRG_03899 [Saprolegnia diclina VS20]EQC38944.1 hypothetical protein SDRG_03899 [Saprolegnia diclina VS20]|eukprot:XP_008607768.1 hypothetical protein SDRG_03899 [Saprolegnia diclina VS20]
MTLNLVVGAFGLGVLYAGEWIDCAPRFLYAPKTIDTSALDAIENPTTKDVKRLAFMETSKIIHAKVELHSFWPTMGLMALFFSFACPVEGLPVLAIIGLVCAYPFLHQKRQRLLLENENEQWEDWEESMLATLRAKKPVAS